MKSMGGQSNSILGSVGNGISKLLGWGGFAPNNARVNNPGVGSWIALGEPNTGTPTNQQNGIFWGGGFLGVVSNAGPQTSILMESPRQTLGQNAAPLLQRLSVKILDGQVDIGTLFQPTSVFTQGVYCGLFGVGIYLADLNAATNLYNTQDPLGPSDAGRFEWIYLESRLIRFATPSTINVVPPQNVEMAPKIFDMFNIDVGVDITPGTALMLSVSFQASAAGTPFPAGTNTVSYQPQLRAFLARTGS